MKETFLKFEGELFKISETDSGFDAFKFIDNSWKRVSGKLIATLFFEGTAVDSPLETGDDFVITTDQNDDTPGTGR